MTVKVKIKEYLDKLKEAEKTKPAVKRKPIPAPPEMAKAIGVERQTMYNFLDRKEHKRIDLRILDGVIKLLRSYGHNTKLTDILEYVDD